MDPAPRGKISTKNCKKKTFLLLKPKSEFLKKREIIKISSFLNSSSSFRIKYAKKIKQKFENYFLLKIYSESVKI